MRAIRAQGWKAVSDAISTEEIDYVFGLTANPWEFWDYLAETPTKPILVRQELSGVYMAMAYSRLSGKVGVVFNSPGPGIGGTFPGLLEAYSGAIPLIAISPSSPQVSYGKGQFQETNFVPAFQQVSKWAFRVTNTENIPWAMERAFHIAINGKPGPVFLEIPMDVGNGFYEDSWHYFPLTKLKYTIPNRELERIYSAITESKKPVILAGGGVILSRAAERVVKFAEKNSIPILTTPSGRGTIPEDHVLAFGQVGLYRTKVSKKVFEEADLLIMLGTQYEEFQSANWKYFPANANLIHIDIDPLTINRNFRPGISAVGDINTVFEELQRQISNVKSARMEERKSWVKSLTSFKREFEESIVKEIDRESRLRTPYIINRVYKIFGKDTILANENGSQDVWSYYFPYYKVLDFYGTLGMPEQTGLSFGVTGAIGAKLASPNKKVVCITGDGAFQFGMHEIATSMQYNAPVTWIVLNNHGLGWEKYYQKYWLKSRKFISTEFTVQPDFQSIAKAYGIYGEKVTTKNKVDAAIRRALDANIKDKISAILDFEVPTFDFPEGFHEFHLIEWGAPKYPIRKF